MCFWSGFISWTIRPACPAARLGGGVEAQKRKNTLGLVLLDGHSLLNVAGIAGQNRGYTS